LVTIWSPSPATFLILPETLRSGLTLWLAGVGVVDGRGPGEPPRAGLAAGIGLPAATGLTDAAAPDDAGAGAGTGDGDEDGDGAGDGATFGLRCGPTDAVRATCAGRATTLAACWRVWLAPTAAAATKMPVAPIAAARCRLNRLSHAFTMPKTLSTSP
jgi:hypothetical protein